MKAETNSLRKILRHLFPPTITVQRPYTKSIFTELSAISFLHLVHDKDPDQEAIQSVLHDYWGLDVRLTTCSGKSIVTKSKKAMAGLSEIRPMRQFKDLWGREIGGMPQGIGTAGRNF
jgi:hypothetical protein